MRRVLVFLIVATALCVTAGLAIPSGAVKVNGETLSTSQLNDELSAINASVSYRCYLQARATNDHEDVETSVHGAGPQTWLTDQAVEWTNTRTTQLAIEQFVEQHNPSAFSASSLDAARSSLASSMTQTVAEAYNNASQQQTTFACTPTVPSSFLNENFGNLTLATMPTWFVDDQVRAQAAVLAMGQAPILPTAIPLDAAGLETFFNQHKDQFETTCLAYIVFSDLSTAEQGVAEINNGLSFAEAAKKYSTDTATKDNGGTLGCYSPNTSAWATVQQYVGSVPTGGISQIQPSPGGTGSYLVFKATKRTPNEYAKIEKGVLAEATSLNEQGAAAISAGVQRSADVLVSSTLGSWDNTGIGGTILPPPTPPASSVLNAAANAPTS